MITAEDQIQRDGAQWAWNAPKEATFQLLVKICIMLTLLDWWSGFFSG